MLINYGLVRWYQLGGGNGQLWTYLLHILVCQLNSEVKKIFAEAEPSIAEHDWGQSVYSWHYWYQEIMNYCPWHTNTATHLLGPAFTLHQRAVDCINCHSYTQDLYTVYCRHRRFLPISLWPYYPTNISHIL